jgi:hypothetical protein
MPKRRRTVVVKDKMQRGYRYILTAPVGRNFEPDFCPDLTPKQMLELGVFCGKYLTDCRKEFPVSWFAHARRSPDATVRSTCSASMRVSPYRYGARTAGFIPTIRAVGSNGIAAITWAAAYHPDDPRGWFQWYCRYYMGRRIPDEDARQIKRWKAIRRHVVQIKRHCEPGDIACRRRQRQALLHWAYDARKI